MGFLNFLSRVPGDVAGFVNRDVYQPVQHAVTHPGPFQLIPTRKPPPTQYNQPQQAASRPNPIQNVINRVNRTPVLGPVLNADRFLVKSSGNMIKGTEQGASSLVKTAVVSPAIQTLAQFSHNPYVKQAANDYSNQNAAQAGSFIQQTITRPAAEAVDTVAHPFTQSQYNPNTPLERAVFGKTPIQNINKNVATNYDAHKNLPALERLGLAGADVAGQLLNVAPAAGALTKGVKLGAEANKAAKVSALVHGYAPESGFIAGKSATGFKAAEKNGVTFKGIEGATKFEGGDQTSKLLTPKSHYTDKSLIEENLQDNNVPLSEVMHHPLLYKNYPDLKDYTVSFNPESKSSSFSANQRWFQIGTASHSPDVVKGALLHEVQHAIQYKENFAQGSNLNVEVARDNLIKEGVKRPTDLQAVDRAYTDYHKSAGEVEARNVQRRMNMTDAQRANPITRPAATEDVPRSEQIVKLNKPNVVENPMNVSKESGPLTSPDKPLHGLEDYTVNEVTNMAKDHLTKSLGQIKNVKVKDVRVIGSRVNGKARPNSDIDVLVHYSGKATETQLNSELRMSHNLLDLEDKPVNFNFTKKPIDEWLNNSKKALESKSNDKMMSVEKPSKLSASDYLKQNHDKALKDYQTYTMGEFKTNKPNIVSADSAKHIIPGMDASKSIEFHPAAKSFTDNYYNELLKDPKTKNQSVLFTAGGTGAGKTQALRSAKIDLNNRAAVVDGNLATFSTATQRIDEALKTGRKVDVQFVYRHPVRSFTHGVLKRAKTEERTISIPTHVDKHISSLKTIQRLQDRYQHNPNVTIGVIDNSKGAKNAVPQSVYFLKNKVYNNNKLTTTLHNELDKSFKQGKINEQLYKTTKGEESKSPVPEVSRQPQPERSVGGEARQAQQAKGTTGPDTTTGVRAGTSRLNKAYGTELKPSTYTKRPQEVLRSNSEVSMKKMGVDAFTGRVTRALAQTPGRLTDQQLSDAYLAAEHHNGTSLGDELLKKSLVHDTKTAQALAARGMLTKSTPLGMKKTILAAFDKAGVEYTGDVKAKVEPLISSLKGLKQGTDEYELATRKLADVVTQQIPRSKLRAAGEFWRAMLISGPQTVAKIAISQPINTLQAYLNQFPAATLDKFRSEVTGKPRTIAAAPLKGGGGLKSGAKSSLLKLRTNVDMPGSGGFVSPFESTIQRGAHQTPIERGIFRTHSSLAKPTFEFIRDNTLARLGKAQAINQGLKGADRKAFIDNYIKSPPQDSYEHAVLAGEKATNQQRTALGTAAHSVQALGSKEGKGMGPGVIVAPITRVPGAIATNALYEYSGAKFLKTATYDGLYKGLIKHKTPPNTARTLAEDFGKAIVGAGGVMSLGALLAATGNLTPPKAETPKEAGLMKTQGKPTGSFRIPGTHFWFSVNALGPVGIELQMGGGFKQGGPAEVAARGGQEIAQQPYLQGISGVGNALSNPKQYAKSFVNNLAGSFIPAAVSQPTAGFDTTQRQVDYGSAKDVVRSKLPGLRGKIPPATDVLGGSNPGENKTGTILGGLMGTIDALKPSATKNTKNPVVGELNRLNINLTSADTPNTAAPLRTQTVNGAKMKLNDKQLSDYIKARGDIIQQGVGNLLNNSKYQKLDDVSKANEIDNVIKTASSIAKINVLGDNPQHPTSLTKLALNNTANLGKTSLKASKVTSPKTPAQTTTIYDPATKTWTQTNHTSGRVTLIASDGSRSIVKPGLGTISNARPDYVKSIKTSSSKYGLDTPAVLAVAAVEGLGGGVGDGGTSYGPFQLHVGGALPPGKTQAWAESPAGIDYALSQISKVAKGKTGQAAIEAIVNAFERPANSGNEINNALAIYGGKKATLTSGSPKGATIGSSSKSGKARTAKAKTYKSGVNLAALRSVETVTKSKLVKIRSGSTYTGPKARKSPQPRMALLKPNGKRA